MSALNDITVSYAFVLDYERTNAYNRFLRDRAKDKIICDIGTGTGVLSYLASVHGAKKVYSYERKKSMFDFASSVLGFASSMQGAIKNIELFRDDATEVKFPPNIDFFVHELFGNLLFEENIEGVIQNIKQQYEKPLVYPSEVVVYKHKHVPRQPVVIENKHYDKEVLDFINIIKEYDISIEDSLFHLNSKEPITLEPINVFNLCTDDLNQLKTNLPNNFYWKARLGKYTYGNYPRPTNNWF